MKSFKTTITVSTILVLALFITSCKNDKKTANEDMNHQTEMNHDNNDGHHDNDATSNTGKREIKASTQKNVATTPIINAYLQIKNGLVDDNKKEAAKAGKIMLTAFSNFDMTKLTGEQHKEYMEILESAKEHAEHIIKSPIDHQREHFEVLSTDIKDLIVLVGTEKTLYEIFCPMYNDGEGAMWLSEFKEIKNPYYGSKMINCGAIVKEM